MNIPFFRKKEESQKPGFYLDLRPKLIKLPDISDKTSINVRYPLIPPFAYAHIFWDDASKEIVYNVEEPVLDNTEKEILRLVQLGMEEMINIGYLQASKMKMLIQYLEQNVQSILLELGAQISIETYQKIMYYVYRDSLGLNEIEPLMNDYFIEDIECNGVGVNLYIVHRKYQNLRTNIKYDTHVKLVNFVEKLAQKAGRYISYAKPLLDGTLPDGSRVNGTYTEDVTTRGPTFTIRKFTKDPWMPLNLMDMATAPAEVFAFLWLVIEHKLNVMVIGETGCGKTTFLNSFVSFIPPEARIVSIEDTREINLDHENWLPSVTRSGFGVPGPTGAQYGEISLFDLLRETFRQNPDYVIVGETRGPETYVLFQGMASGHPSYATFHAGSVETLVRRLQTQPINLPAALIESLDVICILTHIKESNRNFRRLLRIEEMISVDESSHVHANPVFVWNPATDQFSFAGKSVVLQRLSIKTGIPLETLLRELKLRSNLLLKLQEAKINDFKRFSEIVNRYYKEPEALLMEYKVLAEVQTSSATSSAARTASGSKAASGSGNS